MNNFQSINNLGIVELDRTVTLLYNKRLISKDDIKQFINILKDLVKDLPDNDDTFLH
jgi:hypothetical protein